MICKCCMLTSRVKKIVMSVVPARYLPLRIRDHSGDHSRKIANGNQFRVMTDGY